MLIVLVHPARSWLGRRILLPCRTKSIVSALGLCSVVVISANILYRKEDAGSACESQRGNGENVLKHLLNTNFNPWQRYAQRDCLPLDLDIAGRCRSDLTKLAWIRFTKLTTIISQQSGRGGVRKGWSSL